MTLLTRPLYRYTSAISNVSDNLTCLLWLLQFPTVYQVMTFPTAGESFSGSQNHWSRTIKRLINLLSHNLLAFMYNWHEYVCVRVCVFAKLWGMCDCLLTFKTSSLYFKCTYFRMRRHRWTLLYRKQVCSLLLILFEANIFCCLKTAVYCGIK